jgi:hypothetical protein
MSFKIPIDIPESVLVSEFFATGGYKQGTSISCRINNAFREVLIRKAYYKYRDPMTVFQKKIHASSR